MIPLLPLAMAARDAIHKSDRLRTMAALRDFAQASLTDLEVPHGDRHGGVGEGVAGTAGADGGAGGEAEAAEAHAEAEGEGTQETAQEGVTPSLWQRMADEWNEPCLVLTKRKGMSGVEPCLTCGIPLSMADAFERANYDQKVEPAGRADDA